MEFKNNDILIYDEELKEFFEKEENYKLLVDQRMKYKTYKNKNFDDFLKNNTEYYLMDCLNKSECNISRLFMEYMFSIKNIHMFIKKLSFKNKIKLFVIYMNYENVVNIFLLKIFNQKEIEYIIETNFYIKNFYPSSIKILTNKGLDLSLENKTNHSVLLNMLSYIDLDLIKYLDKKGIKIKEYPFSGKYNNIINEILNPYNFHGRDNYHKKYNLLNFLIDEKKIDLNFKNEFNEKIYFEPEINPKALKYLISKGFTLDLDSKDFKIFMKEHPKFKIGD